MYGATNTNNCDDELLSIDTSINSIKNQFYNTNNNFIESIDKFFTELNILKNRYIEKNLEIDKVLDEINQEKLELKKKNIELEEFKKVSFISSMHKRLEEKEQQLATLQQKYNILGKRHNKLVISPKNNSQETNNLKINQLELSIPDSNNIIETQLELSNKVDSDKISETEFQLSNKDDSDKITESKLQLSNKTDSSKISETKLQVSNNSNSVKISETELQVSNKANSDKINETLRYSCSNEEEIDKISDSKSSNLSISSCQNINNESNQTIQSDSNEIQLESINNEEQSSDFEAEIDGKIYLFSKDNNGNGIYFKKLKNGSISKKISGNWKEDSDGELIID